jgi:hypothetical protein
MLPVYGKQAISYDAGRPPDLDFPRTGASAPPHEDASMNVSALVEPDRVHKTVYTDQQIFDLEMEKIWEKIWVYCGHESQVPQAPQFDRVVHASSLWEAGDFL